jgi:hypothetical protein
MQINFKNPFKEMKLDVPSLLLGSFAGLTAGGAGAYLVLRHIMEARLNDRLDAEVADVKAHYNDRLKTQLSDAISLVPEAGSPFVGRPVRDLAGGGGDEERPVSFAGVVGLESEVRTFTITEGGDPYEGIDGDDGTDDGDPSEKRSNEEADSDDESGDLVLVDQAAASPVARNLRKPYIISEEEFTDTPPEWQRLTLTYFAADKVLVDDKDQPIERGNVVKTIGIVTRSDFGAASGDPNICYVRNQDFEVDFEVVLDNRAYADAILHYGQPNRGS